MRSLRDIARARLLAQRLTGVGLASPADVVRWMAQAPARLAGLASRKGAIAEGRDADLVAWQPDAEWRVEPARLHHRTTLTPYAGLTLPGVVTVTWLRGEEVHRDGRAVGPRRGRRLAHHEAAWTSPS